MKKLSFVIAALACTGAWTLPLAAQENTFYLDRAQVSGAPDDGMLWLRPTFHEETRFYGSVSLGWTLNPLHDKTLTDDEDILREVGNPVSNQFISYLVAGTEVARRVSVSVALPIGLYMTGEDPAEEVGADAPQAAVDNTGLHDLRLDARVLLLEAARQRLRLGVGTSLWLPTGTRDTFASDGRATGMPYATAEYDLGALILGGMLGVHWRPDNGIAQSQLEVASDLRWVVGGYVPFNEQWRVGAEFWGTTGITQANGHDTVLEGRNTDAEWLAQARYTWGEKQRAWASAAGGTRLTNGYGAPDIRLLATVGYWFPIRDEGKPAPPREFPDPPQVALHDPDRDQDGYPDSIDDCPTIPEDGRKPDPSDGCPADSDRDHDGIPDSADACPDVPEDIDRVSDTDGCPEEDADHDGIPDAEDKCPLGFGGRKHPDPERFGCPLGGIREGEGELKPLEPIQFEYDSAVIKRVSYPILDDVVAFLRERDDQRLAIHGHTDSQGSDLYNLRLSKARARSVMQYLIKRGIDPQRLESEGYGEERPITTNETAEGRATNRRVDFKLVD